MTLRKLGVTLCAYKNATSRTQKDAHENSAVLRILHLICDDSAPKCLHSFASGRPRAAPARAPVLKCNPGGQGPPLDFEFLACSLSRKCVVSNTAELSRYHGGTLCLPCGALLRGLRPRICVFRFSTTREGPCALTMLCGARHAPR